MSNLCAQIIIAIDESLHQQKKDCYKQSQVTDHRELPFSKPQARFGNRKCITHICQYHSLCQQSQGTVSDREVSNHEECDYILSKNRYGNS